MSTETDVTMEEEDNQTSEITRPSESQESVVMIEVNPVNGNESKHLRMKLESEDLIIVEDKRTSATTTEDSQDVTIIEALPNTANRPSTIDSEEVVIVDEKVSEKSATKSGEDNDGFEDDWGPDGVTFGDQEAALNAYLDKIEKVEQKKQKELEWKNIEASKPKTNRIAELLKKLPQNILNQRPKIKPSTKADIDFEETPAAYDEKQKAIQKLMQRFDIHTAVVKPQKEEHFKIHITTAKEDSQGIAQLKTDEEDYVKVVPDDAIEEITSPQCQAPGVRMGMMKEKMMNEIRAKRAKAYEEKMKAHAMYSEEKELEDKEHREEILLDDEDEEDVSDEESDRDTDDDAEIQEEPENKENSGEESVVEEEEDVEALLDGSVSKKKQRRRITFLEDEADESDEGAQSDDEDEDRLDRVGRDDIDFIDDRSISDGDEPDKPITYVSKDMNTQLQESEEFSYDDDKNPTLSQGFVSQDMFSQLESDTQHSSAGDAPSPSQIPQGISAFLDPNKTPILSAAILNRKSSPFGSWNSNLRCSQNFPRNHISPLIPRLNSDTALEALCAETPSSRTSPAMPEAVARLVGASTPVSQVTAVDDLEGICSARFPTQQPATPSESQEYDSFGFDSGDEATAKDNTVCESANKHETTVNSISLMAETPKTTERQPRVTRLNFDNAVTVENNTEADDEDDDDGGSVVGVKTHRKRKRQLQFSDDEESNGEDAVDKDESEDEEMDEGEDDFEASDVEYDENEEIIPKVPKNALIDAKTGKLRKEFLENEAELSGSELGSGDEDERGLDEYEKEDGDEEELDEDEIRDQVGRYHLKTLLDDDQREIRALQDQYLEDGDLHTDGQGRERKFKWKFMDKMGMQGAHIETLAEGEEGEDETDKRWREEKLEKLRWKKENDVDIEEDIVLEETSQKILDNSQFLKMGKATLRKSKTEVSFSETVITEKSPSVTFERKGSFLCRETTLTRIAESAKISDTVSSMKAGAKGFVFAMVTPPSEATNSKKSAARPKAGMKNQPKKIMRVDRSFDNLDESERSKSIFKFMS